MQGGRPTGPRPPSVEEFSGLIDPASFPMHGAPKADNLPGAGDTGVGGKLGPKAGGETARIDIRHAGEHPHPRIELEPGGAGRPRPVVRIILPFR